MSLTQTAMPHKAMPQGIGLSSRPAVMSQSESSSRLVACQALDPIQATAAAHAVKTFALCGISMYGINQSSEYLGRKTGNDILKHGPPAVAAFIVGSAIYGEVQNLSTAFEPIPAEDRPSASIKPGPKSHPLDLKDFPKSIV